MDRERRMFSVGQHDCESPIPHIFGDVVGIQARETATGRGRRSGGAHSVDGAPWCELDGSGNGGAFRRDEIPSIETKVGECDDVVLRQICRLFDRRMFCQISRRTHNDAPDISAQTGRNKGGVWQMPDPQSDVDTLVYEVDEPIKEENRNGNVRIADKKLVDDW